MYRLLIACVLSLAPAAALAAAAVAVTSEIFVERTVAQPGGKSTTVLVKQKSSPPGTRLVFTHSYRNTTKAPVANFGMTNPMPAGVDYVGTDDATATVSADGGRSWGALAALKVRGTDGTMRAARPEDVTHVRWALKSAIPAGGGGKLSFRGAVK